MFRQLIVTTLAVALVASASHAATVRFGPGDAVTINASDADLNTAAGARVLAVHLRLAANKVCGGDNPLARRDADFPSCRRAAIARAVGRLDAPLLAEALGQKQLMAQSRQ
jgi:UrcA family protein